MAAKEPTNQDHHTVTTVLGIEVEVDDLGRHHQNDATIQRTKEPDDLELLVKNVTMKTTKRRWGRHALPAGFASRQYPKVSNYLMTSKSMMDLRSHNHGFQTIRRNQGNSNAKLIVTPHRCSKVMVKQTRRRNN
jgi:hypothetical protein